MNDDRLVKKVLKAKVEKKRKRGRPRKTWMQQVTEAGKN